MSEDTQEKQTQEQGVPSTPPIPQPAPAQAAEQQPLVQLTQDQYNDLIKRISSIEEKGVSSQSVSAEQVRVLGEIMKEAIGNNDDYALRGFPKHIDGDLDEGDFSEKPFTFFYHGSTTMIPDDVKKGKVVSTPYKRGLVFRNAYRHLVPTTSGFQRNKVVSMATFTTHSKKEADFIRNHTLFGVKYFENMRTTMNIEKQLNDLISIRMTTLGSKPTPEIMAMATGAGITVDTMDIDVIRKELAIKLGTSDYENQKQGAKLEVAMIPSSSSPGSNSSDLTGTSKPAQTVY